MLFFFSLFACKMFAIIVTESEFKGATVNRAAVVSQYFLESSAVCTHHSFSCLTHLDVPVSRTRCHRSQLRAGSTSWKGSLQFWSFQRQAAEGKQSETPSLRFSCLLSTAARTVKCTLLVLFSICHSLPSPGREAETASCLGRALQVDPPLHWGIRSNTTRTHVAARQSSAVQSACPKDPTISCCPLLWTRLNLLVREVTRSRWGEGKGTQHLTAVMQRTAVWLAHGGTALHHVPAHLGHHNPRVTELCHSHIHMYPALLPSTAVIITPKEETWLWLHNRPRESRHYFVRRL